MIPSENENKDIIYSETLEEKAKDQSSELSEDKEIRNVFQMIDLDRDGYISPIELKLVFKSVGMNLSNEEIHELIVKADKDGKGLVSYEEFKKLMNDTSQNFSKKEQIQYVFNQMDLDKTGKISLKNLRKIVQKYNEGISDSDCAKMIEEADFDQDGQVSFDEFYRIFTYLK